MFGMPGHWKHAWNVRWHWESVWNMNSQECLGINHQFHPHHHKQFCPYVSSNIVLKWDLFLTFQTCSWGLWSNSYFPQFFPTFGLFTLSMVPGETQSTCLLPSPSYFILSLVLGAFRFLLFRITHHQYTVSFLISTKLAMFSISYNVSLLHTL